MGAWKCLEINLYCTQLHHYASTSELFLLHMWRNDGYLCWCFKINDWSHHEASVMSKPWFSPDKLLKVEGKPSVLLLVCTILAGDFSKCFPISVCSLQQVFDSGHVCVWGSHKSSFQQRWNVTSGLSEALEPASTDFFFRVQQKRSANTTLTYNYFLSWCGDM